MRIKRTRHLGPLKTYRVWVEQVNQISIDVRARDVLTARDKGYRKWRREYAHSYVCDVRLCQ